MLPGKLSREFIVLCTTRPNLIHVKIKLSNHRKNDMEITRVKASTFVITLILLAALYFVFSFALDRHTTYLTFIQESVSGLTVGSRVEYNGVEVGTVKRIKINHKNPKLIDVVLSVDSSAPVTKNTVAMLAFGDTNNSPYIALADDGNNLEPLTLNNNQDYRVIPSTPSTKGNKNVSLTQIAASLKQFNDTFQTFMDKDAVESFKQLLYSMQIVMGMLAENSKRMNILITNASNASRQLGTFMATGQNTIRTLETQTLPSTYRLIANMDDMLNKMMSLMNDITQNPSVIIRGKARPAPGPGE